MALNGRRDDGNRTSLNDERSVPNRDSAEHDDAARGNKGSDDFAKLNVREGHSMNSIDLEDAAKLRGADATYWRGRALRYAGESIAECVIAWLFVTTDHPIVGALWLVSAVIGIAGAINARRGLRAALNDQAYARDTLAILKRAEWIALCERINHDRAFTRSGAFVASTPKDAA